MIKKQPQEWDGWQNRPVGISQCIECMFAAVQTRRYHCNLRTAKPKDFTSCRHCMPFGNIFTNN